MRTLSTTPAVPLTRPAARAALWALVWMVGLGLLATPALAKKKNDDGSQGTRHKQSEPFAEVQVFIEINDTDGDAGLQILLDGEGWERVRVFDPDGRKVADFRGKRSVAQQGITELFLESSEPSFEEQPLEEFLERFQAGFYSFLGDTLDGGRLFGIAELTHDIPDAPEITAPEDGDEVSANGFTVRWEPVQTPAGIEIVGYQVVVERDDPLRVFRVDVSATATAVSVPPEFLDPATEYKVEVIAREVSGNQTISEVEFETGP